MKEFLRILKQSVKDYFSPLFDLEKLMLLICLIGLLGLIVYSYSDLELMFNEYVVRFE